MALHDTNQLSNARWQGSYYQLQIYHGYDIEKQALKYIT